MCLYADPVAMLMFSIWCFHESLILTKIRVLQEPPPPFLCSVAPGTQDLLCIRLVMTGPVCFFSLLWEVVQLCQRTVKKCSFIEGDMMMAIWKTWNYPFRLIVCVNLKYGLGPVLWCPSQQGWQVRNSESFILLWKLLKWFVNKQQRPSGVGCKRRSLGLRRGGLLSPGECQLWKNLSSCLTKNLRIREIQGHNNQENSIVLGVVLGIKKQVLNTVGEEDRHINWWSLWSAVLKYALKVKKIKGVYTLFPKQFYF